MVSVTLSTTSLLETPSTAKAVLLEEGFDTSVLKKYTHLFPTLSSLVKERKFTGSCMSVITIATSHNNQHGYVILVGVGKRSDDGFFSMENYRRVMGKLMRVMEELKVTSLAFELPSTKDLQGPLGYIAGQTAIMLDVASYHFDDFITDPDRKVIDDRSIILIVDAADLEPAVEGVKKGVIIAESVNHARHWIDLPPCDLHPASLADRAEKIAQKHNLKITVFDEKEIIKMGMGGLAAVSAGSERDCQLVIMEYKAKRANAPTLAFVGKGITFDSGGLSIKPANSMETMKEDMSGAAAVIAAMEALAQLKPDVNIVALAPISENLPSGTATKPGDIVRFYNGKTAEIKNTDAEGRLILADALSYAVKHYKLDAMIDLATLTGSCAAALGPFYAGLMSNHDDFVQKVEKSAHTSGDPVWRLPLPDDYLAAIKSPVADMSNIGSQTYMAGAITAALFLRHFVGKVPWVHLDIAGTAFDVPDLSYFRRDSATGYGVRLLVDLAMNWK